MTDAKTAERSERAKRYASPQYRVEQAQRRQEVADMLARRIPLAEIARRLNPPVDVGTVSRDVKLLLEKIDHDTKEQIAHVRAREAWELDQLEFIASMNTEAALIKRGELDAAAKRGEKIDSKEWERYDRAARAWVEKRVMIKERRAKLLNLDIQVPHVTESVTIPISFIQNVIMPSPRLESGESPLNQVIDGEFTEK